MSRTGDKVTLTLPRDESFLPLLHMVLGGIALRHDLSIDALDDLQLAVDNVLAEDQPAADELTVEVTVGAADLTINLSSLSDRDLREMLLQGQVPVGAEAHCVDVCVLLRSLVDEYRVHDLGSGRFTVDLRKLVG